MSGPTLTTALLAGGKSSRFQSEKALASYDGTPLWRLQWLKLAAIQPEKMTLSLRKPKLWVPPGIDVCYDEAIDAGPLGAIAKILSEITTTHLLVLAVDLPLMTPNFLEKLRSLITSEQGVVPRLDCYFEGLCAIYPRTAAKLAEASLEKGNRSVAGFIDKCLEANLVSLLYVAPHDASLFTNWNYPKLHQSTAND